jgi:hypothetical protein
MKIFGRGFLQLYREPGLVKKMVLATAIISDLRLETELNLYVLPFMAGKQGCPWDCLTTKHHANLA